MSVPPYKFVLFLGTKSGKIVRIVDVFENPQVDILDIGREILNFIGTDIILGSQFTNYVFVCCNGKLYILDKVNMDIVKEYETLNYTYPFFLYNTYFQPVPLIVIDFRENEVYSDWYYFDDQLNIVNIENYQDTADRSIEGNITRWQINYVEGSISTITDVEEGVHVLTGIYENEELKPGINFIVSKPATYPDGQCYKLCNYDQGKLVNWYGIPGGGYDHIYSVSDGYIVCYIELGACSECNCNPFSSDYLPFEISTRSDGAFKHIITADGRIVEYWYTPPKMLDTIFSYAKILELEGITNYTDYYNDKTLFYSRDVNNVLKVVLWNLETKIEKDIDIGIVDVVNVAFANVWK